MVQIKQAQTVWYEDEESEKVMGTHDSTIFQFHSAGGLAKAGNTSVGSKLEGETIGREKLEAKK